MLIGCSENKDANSVQHLIKWQTQSLEHQYHNK